jgi:hypothetical protein
MDDSSRYGQIVAAANRHVAERRLQHSLSFIEIKKVVPVSVRKPVRALRLPRQPEERDDDVVVPQDRRESQGRFLAEHEPAPERLRWGGRSGAPVERPGRRGSDSKVRHRRALVVEDRELAVEAPARETLFEAQRAGGRTERRVRLGRHLSELHAVDQPTTSSAEESDRWAASIDSKRARKFP